jgi:hypothetical protein
MAEQSCEGLPSSRPSAHRSGLRSSSTAASVVGSGAGRMSRGTGEAPAATVEKVRCWLPPRARAEPSCRTATTGASSTESDDRLKTASTAISLSSAGSPCCRCSAGWWMAGRTSARPLSRAIATCCSSMPTWLPKPEVCSIGWTTKKRPEVLVALARRICVCIWIWASPALFFSLCLLFMLAARHDGAPQISGGRLPRHRGFQLP